jgi:hypothetical protein
VVEHDELETETPLIDLVHCDGGSGVLLSSLRRCISVRRVSKATVNKAEVIKMNFMIDFGVLCDVQAVTMLRSMRWRMLIDERTDGRTDGGLYHFSTRPVGVVRVSGQWNPAKLRLVGLRRRADDNSKFQTRTTLNVFC